MYPLRQTNTPLDIKIINDIMYPMLSRKFFEKKNACRQNHCYEKKWRRIYPIPATHLNTPRKENHQDHPTQHHTLRRANLRSHYVRPQTDVPSLFSHKIRVSSFATALYVENRAVKTAKCTHCDRQTHRLT